jgi:predicted kinase
VLRSDVIRKLTLGADPETRLPTEAYTPDITRRVYDALRDKAGAALAAGYTVIIDAVSLRPEERRSFAAIAEGLRVPFIGLWLEAAAITMERRIGARQRDASDATAEVLASQLRQDPGPIDWIRLNAGGGAVDCLAAARHALGQAAAPSSGPGDEFTDQRH